jgi:two-component system OmpR family sensor kinase
MKLRLGRAPWTLRRRLVVSVVALFAVLSVVVGGLSVLSLYNNLDSRITGQLDRFVHVFGGGGGAQVPDIGGSFNQPNSQPGSITAVLIGSTVTGEVRPNIGGTVQTLPPAAAATIHSAVTSEKPTTVSLQDLGTFQFVRVAVSLPQYPTITDVYYGLPLADTQSELESFAGVLGGISLGGILLVALATWFIVSYALRPLRRVAATATEVASMRLDRGEVDLAARVPEADTDQRTEVGKVGAALNTLLGHVDNALKARQESESRVRQFVADASHELRTPLASIRGYAELTRRGNYDLPQDVTHSLGRVESEAVRMTSLVEDLLLLARLDAGRDIETAPVDLSRLLVDCVSDAHVAGSDHEFELDLPDDPVMIEGDVQRIHQVFANLLANARVHTPAGTHVSVTLASKGPGGAVVTIADDGPGIPADLQDDLFERFARGDTSRARATGSTGLGLAIVRAVVDAHGGAVSVSSSSEGTTFTVELPDVSANP